ncbi:MAG: glycosyltransferase family 9 protein [Bryobacteraceae bacterium]
MQSVLECLPRASRVGILRLRSLGDCVLSTPALEILKRSRPDLRLAVMVEDRFRAVFEGNPDLDETLPPRLGALRRWRPRLCLNLHGGGRSAWMTALSGARYRAGFSHFRYQVVYNVRIPRAQEILGVERKVHTAEHLASAVFYLGAAITEIPRAKLAAGGTACPTKTQTDAYAIIHPFATTAGKTWGAGGFLAVAQHLRQSGLEPVFIGGGGDDFSPFQAYRGIAGAPLAEIKRLIAGASLYVGNDSGPAHMAAALGVPSVVIFGASDPAIWGPWRSASEVVIAPAGVAQVLDALARLRVAA